MPVDINDLLYELRHKCFVLFEKSDPIKCSMPMFLSLCSHSKILCLKISMTCCKIHLIEHSIYGCKNMVCSINQVVDTF